MKQRRLSSEATEAISDRLSSLEDLYFPRAIQSDSFPSAPSQRKSSLFRLLSEDPVIFLERHGARLTDGELQYFETLKEDYEVDWHLRRIRDSRRPPTAEEARSRSVTVKNRRRAFLNELIRGGQYFSEEAMRDREPYLHHEYVGKFQDPTGRSMSRPGERWSDTLMRRSEEAILIAKIRGEKERLGILDDGDEEEEEEEDEEEEEEREEDGDDLDDEVIRGEHESCKNGQSAEMEPAKEALSPAEMQDQMEQFTHIMQQKFLTGEDSQHLDYSKIDNDERLDDHWHREVNEDAEEKYFADD